MIQSYQKALHIFFRSSETITSQYSVGRMMLKEYSRSDEGWCTTYRSINNWRSLYVNEEYVSKIYSAIGIDDCLDSLAELVPLREFSIVKDDKKTPLLGEDRLKKNREMNKRTLLTAYLDYKEMHEIISHLTINKYISVKVEEALAEQVTVDFRAPLIGFNMNGISKIVLGEIVIEKLIDEDKKQMMNSFDRGIMRSDPIHVGVGFNDCSTSGYWIKGRIKTKYCGFKSTGFVSKMSDDVKMIEEQIESILKALRLFKSIDVGIRGIYIRRTLCDTAIDIAKWFYEIYKYGDFGSSEKIEPGHFSRDYHQNFMYKVNKDDIEGLKRQYNTIQKYYTQPLEQISQAIEYFSGSFEQTRGTYIFTDLLMGLETLLNNPDKINELNKENIMKKFDSIRNKIDATDDLKKISRLIFKLQDYKGMPAALRIGAKILYSDREEQKKFNNFFYSNTDSEVSCYRLRNNLLHGNDNSDISNKIKRILPELSIYIRKIINILIERRVSGDLDCDNTTYFDKLKEIAASKEGVGV
ncbi:MAG: hypothetical protein K8S62_11900 [Candidatus Sabulitectum sp.]|nr:hypothetical protein [Candidatus Sabulitectum sp.]